MDNSKLEKIRETSQYYKILLRIFSTDPNEKYKLTEEEQEAFKDEELFNQFITDLAGMIILMQTENKSDQDPNEHAFNKLFKIDSSIVSDLKEQMKQIRNCFAHAETKKTGENIEFDNGKIKGKIQIDQLIFLPSIYGINDLYEEVGAAQKILGTKINIEELLNDTENYMAFLQAVKPDGTRILAGGIVGEQIRNENDLNKLFKMGKVVKFLDKKEQNNSLSYMYSRAILKLIDWKNMSPTQLTKIMKGMIPGNANFQIKSLREYSELINAYIDYVGKEAFYNLDFSLQREIISNLVQTKEDDRNMKPAELGVIYFPIIEIQKLVEKGISEVDLNMKNPKQFSRLITNSYMTPQMYESVMYSYIYNRLIYLKEMLNTNQIDESILNYSDIDISDINCRYTFTKKDIQSRKQEINRALLNVNKSIEVLKTKRMEFQGILKKNDNPRNPKRDKMLREYTEKIGKMDRLIAAEEEQKKKLEEEKKYIEQNKKLPVNANMIFRTLRNSATHGFRINLYSRIKAFKNHNLEDLIFEFEDSENKGSKAQISMTAGRLVKLVSDIEDSIVTNISRINDVCNPLKDAIGETERNIRTGDVIGIAGKIAIRKEDRSNTLSEENLNYPGNT